MSKHKQQRQPINVRHWRRYVAYRLALALLHLAHSTSTSNKRTKKNTK